VAAERIARETLATLAELGRLLDEETGHVKAMRVVALRELQEPKARLSERLLEARARLVEDGSDRALPPSLAHDLAAAQARFSAAARANARALAAARTVNERMLRMLAEVASTTGRAPTLYAPKGPATGSTRRPTVAIAFDRRA
jgi:hypothetical protein